MQLTCKCRICAESVAGWQVIWFPGQLFAGYRQCHSTSNRVLWLFGRYPGVSEWERVTCGRDQCRKWCHDHYCAKPASANYCKLFAPNLHICKIKLLCQTSISAFENLCSLYRATSYCTATYSTVAVAVISKFPTTGSVELRDMGMDWSAASSDRGHSSQICLPSHPLHLPPQTPKLTNFHFPKYAYNEKLSLSQTKKSREREGSPYWSLAISSVTRSHGARLTNLGLLRHNFHFSDRQKQESKHPIFPYARKVTWN